MLMAILHSLRLARRLGYENVVCESDSPEKIKIINEDYGDFHHYLSIVQDICLLLRQCWTVEIHHTLR